MTPRDALGRMTLADWLAGLSFVLFVLALIGIGGMM